MSARFKPGSRVQQVWEVFEAKGAEAAYNFGLTLSLKATTLKAWCRSLFPGNKAPGRVSKDKDGKVALPKRQSYSRSTDRMKAVEMTTGEKAFIAEEGPEQSLLYFPGFADEQHQAEFQCFSNHWFYVLDKNGKVDAADKKAKDKARSLCKGIVKLSDLERRKKPATNEQLTSRWQSEEVRKRRKKGA